MKRVAAVGLLPLGLVALWGLPAYAPGNCSVFSTYSTNEILTASSLNSNLTQAAVTNSTPQCLDDYSANDAQMQTQTDPYPSSTTSRATSLAGELERIRYQLAQIMGVSYWYQDPPTTLTHVGSHVAAVLDRDVTAINVVDTDTETTVYSYSVPANTLGTTRKLRLTLLGDYLNNSGSDRSLTIRGKYGATTFAVIGHATISTSANRRAVSVAFELSALNATNAQVGSGWQVIGQTDGVGGGAIGQGYSPGVSMHVTVAEDSTAAQTLAVTIQHSYGATSISFRLHTAHLEHL